MPFTLSTPPKTICLLRLSALGDITHVLPTLRTLQKHWPDTKITWIIGKTEYQLVKDIKNVDFVIFDKSAGYSAYFDLNKQLKQKLKGGAFDILLHMQLSLRASIASLFIPAQIKLGFDKARAKDLQTIFCNAQINPESTRQHVLDSFLEFPRHFGLEPVMQWQLPVSNAAIESVRRLIASDKKIMVINPCAVAKSKNWRNWTAQGYADVADIIAEKYNMQIILTGGNSSLEKDIGMDIQSLCKSTTPLNLIASTSIDELVAILHLASLVLAPDTGPVHIASALNTKTVGLYASTNPDRAGPYKHRHLTVNKYPKALSQYFQMTTEQASWGKRIKSAECMTLITVDDVVKKIDAALCAPQ